MSTQTLQNTHSSATVEIMTPIAAEAQKIGAGFEALSFNERQFSGLMDPLVMVDHFTMTEPTFGAHPHAGMSAVSMLFEDSTGKFNNRDSLGNDIDLLPGDLYWLKAARGAVHDEEPRPSSRTHALQIFVNLPADLKQSKAESLHVRATDMPVIEGPGHKVRVVLGVSNGIKGAQSPTLPLTILDARLTADGAFTHSLPSDKAVWIHPIQGEVNISLGGREISVSTRHAIALRSGDVVQKLTVRSAAASQFVLIQGAPIRESFIQKGPFVMSTTDEVERVMADHKAGRLGSID